MIPSPGLLQAFRIFQRHILRSQQQPPQQPPPQRLDAQRTAELHEIRRDSAGGAGRSQQRPVLDPWKMEQKPGKNIGNI